MLEKGHLDGSCLTVTGKTMAENLAELPGFTPGQDVIGTFESPVKPTGHIAILRGNLAPGYAVGKITGKEGTRFVGPARCFDAEEDMMAAVAEDHASLRGAVIVIRCASRSRLTYDRGEAYLRRRALFRIGTRDRRAGLV